MISASVNGQAVCVCLEGWQSRVSSSGLAHLPFLFHSTLMESYALQANDIKGLPKILRELPVSEVSEVSDFLSANLGLARARTHIT